MIERPTISIPVIKGSNLGRKQYLSTLPIRSLMRILSNVIQNEADGAGLRIDRSRSKKIARTWDKRGRVESLQPIVVAISADSRFQEYSHLEQTSAGVLEFSFDSILDVCDGIQRLKALEVFYSLRGQYGEAEWPVHFIVVSNSDELKKLNLIIRQQAPVEARRPASIFKENNNITKWIDAVIFNSEFLRRSVAYTKSSLALRSPELWTGTAVRKALLDIQEKEIVPLSTVSAQRMAAIWDQLPEYIDDLRLYHTGDLPTYRIRKKSSLPKASVFYALAFVVAYSLTKKDVSPEHYLKHLRNFDWEKDGDLSKMRNLLQQREEWSQRLLHACGLVEIEQKTKHES